MVDMFMDEYDEEKIARLFRRDAYREGHADGREEGRAEGLQEGRIESFAGLVRDGLLDVAIAAERAGVTEDEIRRVAKATK